MDWFPQRELRKNPKLGRTITWNYYSWATIYTCPIYQQDGQWPMRRSGATFHFSSIPGSRHVWLRFLLYIIYCYWGRHWDSESKQESMMWKYTLNPLPIKRQKSRYLARSWQPSFEITTLTKCCWTIIVYTISGQYSTTICCRTYYLWSRRNHEECRRYWGSCITIIYLKYTKTMTAQQTIVTMPSYTIRSPCIQSWPRFSEWLYIFSKFEIIIVASAIRSNYMLAWKQQTQEF